MWSQLAIGWQWSAPDTAGTAVATFVMTGTILVLAVLALLAALPVAWTVVARLARGPGAGPARPVRAVPGRAGDHGRRRQALRERLAGHRRSPVGANQAWCPAGWPRSPGRRRSPSPRSGRTPPRWPPSRRPNSPGWPSARSRWPALVAGAATAVRRTELSPAVLRFEGRLGVAACVTMAVFLGAGCAWLGRPDAAAGEPVPRRRDRCRRARGHGAGARGRGLRASRPSVPAGRARA